MKGDAQAEARMRNIGLRMKNREIGDAVGAWRCNYNDEMRANDLLRKVGGRWKNQDLFRLWRNWRDGWQEARGQARAEEIMRRVGGRWRNLDLSNRFRDWANNARNDMVSMWKNRAEKSELALKELELQIVLKVVQVVFIARLQS